MHLKSLKQFPVYWQQILIIVENKMLSILETPGSSD